MGLKNNETVAKLLEKVNEKNFYYIFGGVLLCIFLLDYFILMRPQLNALAKINPEIKTIQDDLKKAESDIENKSGYEKQISSLSGQLDEIQLKVRPREEVPLILERISMLANKNNIRIDQIMPASEDMEIVLDNNERTYYSLPILIDAKGSYHNFGRFLNDVEYTDIYIRMGTFNISSVRGTRMHSIKLMLEAMVFDEDI